MNIPFAIVKIYWKTVNAPGVFKPALTSGALSLWLAIAAPTVSAAPVTLEGNRFQQGIQAYGAGDFEGAFRLFVSVSTNALGSGTCLNLGNASWKCGRTGEAILAWERALWLDPFYRDAKANLRYARKAAQVDGPDLTWYEVCSEWLPGSAWGWIASGSFWFSASLLLLPAIFRWRKTDWQQGLAAASCAVFLLTLPALAGIQSRSRLGVILPQQVPLRLTPTEQGEPLAKLAGGEMARRERFRDGYVYIRTANDSAGWVKRTEFEPVCP